jgi:hypothetical protein
MIHAGMNLREALDDARRMGCEVSRVYRTGELLVTHPSWPRRVRVNSRRLDAPRHLIGLLLRLARAEKRA